MKKALFALFILMTPFISKSKENLDVLTKWLEYTDNRNSLYHYFANMAYDSLTARKSIISQLQTEADWIKRQHSVRRKLYSIIGPFPDKKPLNARVVGHLQRPEFKVEKIIFESQPNFYVTGCIFIPEHRQQPAPTIIYCSGHTVDGFRSETYQKVILNLTLKGFIVFAFDPVGQGERLQYFDPVSGESAVGGPTKEHSYPGAQCFIAGSSLAMHMIWDGIRAVDYLLTRPEVDAKRIGITGRSGGGTQSSYIAAFDERIYAAAPECYITNFTRLLQSIGLQDAEQNFPLGIKMGIDHGDLIEVRAPKPTLLIGTTRDFFSVQGLIETFAEAKSAYSLLGGERSLQLALDDSTHASTQKNREAMYDFFQQHLKAPGDPSEVNVHPFKNEELFATSSGQLTTSLGGETIFSLNKKRARTSRNLVIRQQKKTERIKRLEETMCLLLPSGPLDPVFAGRRNCANFAIEKYFIDQTTYAMPFIIIRPLHNSRFKPVLWLSPCGKERANENWTLVNKLVKAGWSIVFPDLIGTGECGPGDFHGDAYTFKQGKGAYNIWFFGLQMGESIVRVRAREVLLLQHYLQQRAGASTLIPAIAEGIMGPVLQHAATAEPEIAPVILVNSLSSIAAILDNEYYFPELIHGVDPFLWPKVDLTDLNSALVPRGLVMINPLDHLGRPITQEQAENIFSLAKSIDEQLPKQRLQIICKTNNIDQIIYDLLHEAKQQN